MHIEDLINTEGLFSRLDEYDRCLQYIDHGDKILIQSGRYPNWRRFQEDLHSCINVQSYGYAFSHVHKRKMLKGEMQMDDKIDDPDEWDYTDRPETCIITLLPISKLIKQGVGDEEYEKDIIKIL